MQGVSEVYSTAMLFYPDAEEEKMTLCVEAAVYEIANYCGLSNLPRELWLLAAKRAAELYYSGEGRVKSMTRGDYSVTYGEDFSKELKTALQPYRKVRW